MGVAASPRQRDRTETRRYLAALQRREAWLDSRIERGAAPSRQAMNRQVVERNALRWAIAVADRYVAEGGVEEV